jgi:hypothetical protein
MRPVEPPTCSDLPVSSSMCARSISTRNTEPSSSGTSRYPFTAIGSSYWDVWKFFGMSG